MRNKLLEVFKNGCINILDIDGSKITEDIKLLNFMDDIELAEILMYMEEQLECNIDIEIIDEMMFFTVERFVNTVCEIIR